MDARHNIDGSLELQRIKMQDKAKIVTILVPTFESHPRQACYAHVSHLHLQKGHTIVKRYDIDYRELT
jgi:hypothetical protein